MYVDVARATRRSSPSGPGPRAVMLASTKATRRPPEMTSAVQVRADPGATAARKLTLISALEQKTRRPSAKVTAAAPMDESAKADKKPPCMIPAGLAKRSSARIVQMQRPGTDLSAQ